MIINVTKLPSNFKPYPFKSFKMKAMSLQQAIDLGKAPKLADIVKLYKQLVDDEIDVDLLVPVDVKFLLSMLAFHAYPKQTWTLDLTCPHCKDQHKRTVTMADFPPVPSLTDDDPYPLTIDDGVHVWELGYPTIAAMDELLDKMSVSGKTEDDLKQMLEEMDPARAVDMVVPYILSVDGSKDGIREKVLGIEDFGIIELMLETILAYFTEATYSEFPCPKCKKTYRVPLSAVEVAQFTPFHNKTAISKYKVNFRL